MSDVRSGMWRDVLLRLPAESLLRFRAVCKRWRTIIDDPVFVKAHTNNQLSSNSNTILLRNSAGQPFYPLYYFNSEALNFTVDSPQTISVVPLNLTRCGLSRVPALPAAACNGLLLTAPEYRKINWDPKGTLEIRNPLTHECLKLPPLDFNSHVEGFGIGYDSAADDYKVVVIDYNCCNGKPIWQTRVYSMKSDSWKTIGNFPSGLPNQDRIQCGVYLDGAVHWLSSSGGYGDVIIAFDVGTENYQQLALPDFETRPASMQLDALSGCLFLSCLDKISYKGELSMWVMNDYGTKYRWKVLLSKERSDLRPVAYMKNSHCLLVQHYYGFIWFNVESKSKKTVTIHGVCKVSAQACVGSLFRLHDSCGGGRAAVAPPSKTTRMKMGYNKLTFCVRRFHNWPRTHNDCFKLDSDWYNSPCQGIKEIFMPHAALSAVHVPLDLCREIFLRLPAKSLVRFRGVCKAWRAVIDEPDFVKSHDNKQLSSNTIIIRNTSGPPFYPLYSFDLDNLDFTDGIQKVPVTPLDFTPSGLSHLRDFPVAACNGLMLIAREKTFEIWNPTTHERLGLPRGKFNSKGAVIGLGYDESTNDYKAVVIHSRCRDRERETHVFRTHIYSLRSDSWRMIGNVPNADSSSGPEGHGVFFHGALHWLFPSELRWGYTILSLDLGTEKYRQMELPTLRVRHSQIAREKCIYVLGGCLILNDFGIALDAYDRHYDVWVMNKYGDEDSWVKLFSIDEKDYQIYDNFSPVAYMKDGMRVFLQEDRRGFYMFDFEMNTLKKVGIHGLSSNSYAQKIPGTIFRLHDNCSVNGRKRRRRRRIIRKREGEMKLCDTELYFCVKDAALLGYEEHDNCYSLEI